MYFAKLEKEFMYRGLKCIATINPLGVRCGYVGVPKSNKYYKGDGCKGQDADSYCHGGITYRKDHLYVEREPDAEKFYWYGFDCLHYTDLPDYEAVKEKFPDAYRPIIGIEDVFRKRMGVVRDTEFVIENCKILADDLLK